jgi:hypothetical protein
MKKIIGVLIGVIIGLVVIIAVLTFLVLSNVFVFNRSSSSTAGITSPPIAFASPSINSSSTPLPSNTGLPATTAPPVRTPTPTGTASMSSAASSPTSQKEVNFTIAVSSFSISGATSGTVTAQIANIGNIDAHNAWIKVEIYSQGSLIKVNGGDYFRKDLGTIKAKTTLTTQATLNISFIDGLKILQSGATFTLTIYSDEKTQTLNYEYHL